MMKILAVSLLVFLALPRATLAATGFPKIFGNTGLSDRSMNPAISANGLFLAGYGPAAEMRGLGIQEVELDFTASVDPYFLGNVVLTSDAGTFIKPEEAYMSTLSLPMVTLKAGKFRQNFGKDNPVHTHALPLIDRSLIVKTLFGDGLNSVGVQASLLVPTPWYFDLSLAGVSASRDETGFASPSSDAIAGVLRMEHLFDLTDETTLALGVSGAAGDNQANALTYFYGADLTLKNISKKSRFGIAWTTEFIKGYRKNVTQLFDGTGTALFDFERAYGGYSTVLFRFTPRFWAGARVDMVKKEDSAPDFPLTTAENLVLAYVPSEFSAIRLQGGLTQITNRTGQWQVLLQYNMTIGSHPAHAY